MRIAIFLLTILFTTLIFSTTYAAVDRCPRQQVKTNLKNKLAKTRVFKGTSDDFSNYVLGHHRGEGNKVLGFVSQAELYTKLKYKFEIKKVGEDNFCVNLEEVDGYFYAAPKLYMPTDYKKSSCEYQQIYKHEKRHLQAVYDFHKRSSGKYASHLGRVARTVPVSKPVKTQKEINEIKQFISNYFEQEFRVFETKSLMQLNSIQQKIDSPQEYIGVRKRCDNW
jgi:hypothetical protein